jgi:hypothetical protein
VEVFETADGRQLLSPSVALLIQEMAGFSVSTGMSWTQLIQNKPEEVQTMLSVTGNVTPINVTVLSRIVTGVAVAQTILFLTNSHEFKRNNFKNSTVRLALRLFRLRLEIE